MISLKLPPTVRGLLSVLGATLIFFVAGSFHGSFGNMLPYLSSYRRQFDPSLTNGDLSVILSAAGIAQGLSYLLAGSVLIPLFGSRRCLLIGIAVYLCAPLLSYLVIDHSSILPLAISYGGLSGGAMNLIVIPVMLIPATWFPDSKGKVVGCVNAGMGLSALFFTPLQTLIINPENVAAGWTDEEEDVEVEQGLNRNRTNAVYFTSKELIHRIPVSLLYSAGIYASLFALGFVFCTTKSEDEGEEKGKEGVEPDTAPQRNPWNQIRGSFSYLRRVGFKNRDFYLLFTCRFLSQIVCSAMVGYYKTFCLMLLDDDRMISIVGGVNGILNAISRFLAGALIDRLSFNRLFPAMYLICSLALASFYWVGQVSFPGLVGLLWTIYLVAFTHFTIIPTQAIRLFDSEHSSIILGGIGLADTLAYGLMSLLSYIVFNGSTPMPYLTFFSCLAGIAGLCAGVAVFVRNGQTDKAVGDDLPNDASNLPNDASNNRTNQQMDKNDNHQLQGYLNSNDSHLKGQMSIRNKQLIGQLNHGITLENELTKTS